MRPITDPLLDQLQDELRELARSARSAAVTTCEDDEAKLDKELAWMLDEIAVDRHALTRFAFLLREHSTRHSALVELTGGNRETA